MKRGKDDEKIMEPMFPRLHVNDTEKGGPRAPPRNKMALYEQLSIPSQRFNAGVSHLNPNNSAGVVPASSSRQGFGHDGGMCFPIQASSTHPAEKTYARNSDFNTPLVQSGQKKKLDEEDFMVPIFVQAGIDQGHDKNSNGMDREKISPSSPAYLCHSMNSQNDSNREPERSNVLGPNIRQEARSQNVNPKEFMAVGEQSVKSVKSSSARENIEGPLAKMNAPSGQEHRDYPANSFGRLQSTGASLHHESRARSQLHNSTRGNDTSNETIRGIENGHSSIRRRDSCLEELGSPNNTTDNMGYHEDKTHQSLRTGNWDRSDDASETSMVDSISGLDISPDDVVGIIGQKHFWKARRAIVNQQRVFAVQVFELHRLIKVQRLIAESPNICLEDGAYLGKPLKGSCAKKRPLEYIVKPYPHIVKHKDDSENLSHKMECSAENAVGKASFSSVQNVSQPSSYGPRSGNPLPPPVVADAKLSPCFHQPTGRQWLIPVMSPSEGLIYKPYPGHGFTGPVCGGLGPPGSNPMMGNFMNHAYGVPAPHHHYQGIGVSPTPPPFGHGYFLPYGMPVISPAISGSAVEQGSNFTCSQPGQLVGGGANFDLQRQSSCNMPTQNNGVIPNVVKPHASKESELQGSTASSPGERALGTVVGQTTGGGNALPLFPASPAVHAPQGAHDLHDTTDQPTRVIRVVPRNARSATESVARIFQSIQEERKHHDSV